MLQGTFGSYYELAFESNYTSLTPAGFSIGFNGVKLRSDTTNKYMMSKFAPIFFDAQTLEANNIGIFDLLLKSDINVNSFMLKEPKLVFLVGTKSQSIAKSNNSKSAKPNSLIKELELGSFQLKGGSAAFVFMHNQLDTLYAGRDLNVEFNELDIIFDSTGVAPQNVLVEQVTIDLKEVKYNPKLSAYKYQMEHMILDYEKENLLLEKVDLIPKRSLYSMTLKEKYQKTMFDISIGQFELKGLSFDTLKNMNAFRASSGMLTDAKFTLLRNANYYLDPKAKELMNESLAKSSFPIDLDTLFINNAEIDYRIVPKGKSEEGRVSLTNIDGYLAGVYSEDHKKDTLKLELTSDFMEHGKFSFAASFPLNDVPFNTYQGHISQLPFTDLNSIITPMAGVQLNAGIIEDIFFTGTCTNTITNGQMIFDYDNLKLQVNNEKKGKKNWLLTDIGNILVRHNSKKDKDGRSKSVAYEYERPPYQGHIGFYLNGILDGMMKTMLPKAIYKAATKGIKPKAE